MVVAAIYLFIHRKLTDLNIQENQRIQNYFYVTITEIIVSTKRWLVKSQCAYLFKADL